MSLMEQFANPDTIHSLSMGEKLAGAGITTLMGMGITFLVLILLWGCIAVMTKFTYRPNKGEKAPQTTDAAAAPSAPETVTAAAADDTLIAVISAAIAAYEGGSANNLVVRKIRRISGDTTAWGDAGRADCIDSRKF
ncbi:OadG family protein [bacterium 210820-DFI.6.37]|nr:OadG family protein [bacterium 210820-DFI.6.37]